MEGDILGQGRLPQDADGPSGPSQTDGQVNIGLSSVLLRLKNIPSKINTFP